MSGDTEREALTEVIASTYTVFSDDHGELADAILAEFMPAHDDRVRVEYEERRRPDPIHVDNIDGANAATWLAEHDALKRADVLAQVREGLEAVVRTQGNLGPRVVIPFADVTAVLDRLRVASDD